MPYFKSIDLAIIALSAGLWGVVNSIFSPIVFQMFGLPILCDLIGFSVLTVAVWWTRKLGSVTVIGLIATARAHDVSVEFIRGERMISLVVRNDILNTLDLITSDDQAETVGREILQKTDEELFLIDRG